MPKLKSVPSLRHLGIQTVVRELEAICYGCDRHYLRFREMTTGEDFLLYHSPLACLPSTVLNEICEEVLWSRGTVPHTLSAVLLPNLTSCRLPSLPRVLPLAFKLLAERCPSLSVLELTCCRGLDGRVFALYLCSGPRLTSLNLEGTSFDNTCLNQLIRTASQLISLNMARTNISDEGFHHFSKVSLPELKHLNLGGLGDVSPALVAHLMDILPDLHTLEYDRMAEVLRHFSCRKKSDGNSTCGLTRLCLSSCSRSNLEAAAWPDLCPNLVAFSMDNSHFVPEMITGLRSFAHLSQLELGWASLTEVNSCLYPLLKAIGGRLTHLSLENCENCDMLSLGQLCPQLTNLKLSAFLTSNCSEKLAANSPVFSHLEEAYIFNSREAVVPTHVIRKLLSGGSLRTAYFQGLAVRWEDLLTPKTTGCLQTVSFEYCSDLTLASLLQLLRMNSPLGVLHVWSCERIGSYEQMVAKKLIQTARLDVSFQWQGSEPEGPLVEHPRILRDLLLPLLGVNILPEQ